MNPFVVGPRKGCQLLRTAVPVLPRLGPREVRGLGRVPAGPRTAASAVVRGQRAALPFTRSLTPGKREPSLDLTPSSVTWV